uniref:Uncharacterized protein n=1 Tax=Acrobeloides nanus TaxID=290746 RepID=A0A914DWG0_9BILA
MSSEAGLGKNVLITGASRGIGLTFIQHLESQQCRRLDVQDDISIKFAAEEVQKILGDEPLNLLINNAGIFEIDSGVTMENPNRATFLRHFDVNAVSYAIVTSVFLPLLLKAASLNQRALVVNISSFMASIEIGKLPPEDLGCSVVYGMSKAAQNRYTRVFGKKYVEEGIIAIAINPGSVSTEMNPKGNVSADDSIADMLRTFAKLKKEDAALFIDRFGKPMPF